MGTYSLRKSVVIALTLSLVVALTVAFTSPAEAQDDERLHDISWQECFERVAAQFADLGVVYECGELDVPLDYDDPNGATTTVKMVRLPAADPANKIGSIFLNPGGPGGSGINFALFFGPFAQFEWGPEVAARFDIVGFDPRGVVRSDPIECFDSFKERLSAQPPLAFPQFETQIPLFEASSELLNDSCVAADPPIADHMSTANVAKDLDLMRQAVGDEYLNFVGLSYGSYLGVTYANLFPDRVRALVVDGVLDPVAWANVGGTTPFSTALRSDHGAQATLEEFTRQCDAAGPAFCAFAPDSADRFAALAEYVESTPVLAINPFTGRRFAVDYPSFIGEILGALYNPFAYSEAAVFLAVVEATATPVEVGAALSDMRAAAGLVINPPNFAENFPAVACSDTSNPDSLQTFFDVGQEADAAYGYFGSLWTWAAFPCADWSLVDSDAYTGPYTAETAHPVMVIGNLYDPATRYEGATAVRDLLPNSALITVDAPGHTSLGISPCAGFHTGLYLLDPSVAPSLDGLVCDDGVNWFEIFGASATGADLSGFRTQVMDEIAFRP